MHSVESHPARFLREMNMRDIRFFASNCMFNVKHLALTDLIFLLVLILQIGNSTYFSATNGISSWRAKLRSQRAKHSLPNAVPICLGKTRVFSLSNLHEGANNFSTKLFILARQDSTNSLMPEYRRLLSKQSSKQIIIV